MSELCPVFVMNSEEIVDVFYVPMEEIPGGWSIEGVNRFTVVGHATHTVVETPIGCYGLRIPIRPGETLTLERSGGGHPLEPCQRIVSEVREHVASQS